MADEQGEVALRGVEHVGPGGVAVRQVGAARPAQGREHRRRQVLDGQAAVGVVGDLEVLRLLLLGTRGDRQHGAQHAVGAVGGEALEAGLPGVEVEVLEVDVGVVFGDVDRLGDRGVDVGGDGRDHVLVGGGGDLEGGDEVVGQLVHVAAEVAVEAPGVVFDRMLLEGAVGHPLLAGVGVGERRFDAVGGVVGEGQADGAGGRDGQQVGVAQAVLADLVLDLGGQAGGEVAAGEVEVGVEQREGTTLLGELDGGQVGLVAHELADLAGHVAGGVGVVAQAQHGQGVAQAGEAEADAALGLGFGELLLEGPVGGFEHVVEHADRGFDGLAEAGEVEAGLVGEGVLDVQREVDRAQAAAAVGGQGLLGAGVGGLDGLAVVEVVVAVHPVEEQDARLGVVVGGAHDLIPQVAGAHLAVHPQAVVALVAAGRLDVVGGLGLVGELDVAIGLDGLHEGVGHGDGDVEVGQVAVVLGVDEFLDVRVVAAQHAHLGAAAGAGGFDGLAGAVEDAHVGHRAGGIRLGAAHHRALRADRREVVADPAAAAHGLGGLGQGGVDAAAAVDGFGDRVAHGLHEAVDQGGGEVGAGGGVDAAGGNEAALLGFEELGFPEQALVFRLDGGEGAGHAQADVGDGLLVALGVFLEQHLFADLLREEVGGCCDLGFCVLGGGGHGLPLSGLFACLIQKFFGA